MTGYGSQNERERLMGYVKNETSHLFGGVEKRKEIQCMVDRAHNEEK